MATAISDIKQAIKERALERICGVSRTLAMWAEEEANIIEYQPDFNIEEE